MSDPDPKGHPTVSFFLVDVTRKKLSTGEETRYRNFTLVSGVKKGCGFRIFSQQDDVSLDTSEVVRVLHDGDTIWAETRRSRYTIQILKKLQPLPPASSDS